MPGVVKHLASVDNNASGISLGNAHLTVFLFCLSPIIIVRPGDSPPIVPDLKDARDRVHNGLPASFEVASAWGGREPFVTKFDFPPNIQLFAPGKEYAGDVEVEDAHLMRRNPAMDESGKNLAFVLDEVDRHVMDARKHFRLPAPGDEESPKRFTTTSRRRSQRIPTCWRGWGSIKIFGYLLLRSCSNALSENIKYNRRCSLIFFLLKISLRLDLHT